MPSITIKASDLEDQVNDNMEIKIDSIQFYRGRQPDIEFTIENLKDFEYEVSEDNVLELLPDCRFSEYHIEAIAEHIPEMVQEYPNIAVQLVQELLTNMDDQVLHQVYDSIKFRVPNVEKISFWKKIFGK